MTTLCWRHGLRLFLAAYGSLLDLTGRAYPRFAKPVIESAHACPRCQAKNARRVARL